MQKHMSIKTAQRVSVGIAETCHMPTQELNVQTSLPQNCAIWTQSIVAYQCSETRGMKTTATTKKLILELKLIITNWGKEVV